MKGLKVYYLEDVKDDFFLLKEELNINGVSVYPKNESQWCIEIDLIKNYLLSNQTEKESQKSIIKNIFKSKDLDLFIFDFYLIGQSSHSGTIYTEIIQGDVDFANIPVIFLSIVNETAKFELNTNTSYVLKQDYMNEENISSIYNKLNEEIKKFPTILKKLTLNNKSSNFI